MSTWKCTQRREVPETRSLRLSMLEAPLELGCAEILRLSLRSWSHGPACKLTFSPCLLGDHNCPLRVHNCPWCSPLKSPLSNIGGLQDPQRVETTSEAGKKFLPLVRICLWEFGLRRWHVSLSKAETFSRETAEGLQGKKCRTASFCPKICNHLLLPLTKFSPRCAMESPKPKSRSCWWGHLPSVPKN